MKYVIFALFLAASISAAAAEKKVAQEKVWTNEYQYGENEHDADGDAVAAQKALKGNKPSEGGEFEVAPKE